MSEVFSPTADGVAVSGSTTSASQTLPGSTGTAVRVVNGAAAVAFVKFGTGAQTAVANTSIAVGAGATAIFGLPAGADTVAAVLASGTGNVYFQRGSVL